MIAKGERPRRGKAGPNMGSRCATTVANEIYWTHEAP